jgi:anti-sigma B factor antagonist
MKLSIDSDDGQTVKMKVAGSVTQQEITLMADPVSDLLGPEAYRRRVCMDLGNAGFLDSSGINWLILNHKRFRENGGKLVLHSLPPLVMNVIKVLKMHRVFDIAESPQAAFALASGECATGGNP